MEREVPRKRRGAEAVEAAMDELEIRERIDEPDPSLARSGEHDLRWAREHIDEVRTEAETDVLTPDEAMGRLASTVGREYPAADPDDEEQR